MFLNRGEYDRGVNTFSPEGRLFQVEYAIEAIKLGSTAIGIKTKEGVIMAVEKRLTSTLLEASSVEKIMEIDTHIAAAMSGLYSDGRTLIDHARVEAQNHTFTYNEPIKVQSLTQSVCDLALGFGEDGDEKTMSRPYGVALLMAGCDSDGAHLFHTDPSGTFSEYKAKAVGSGADSAQTALEENYNEDVAFDDAELLALRTLKEVMEEKLNDENVEVASLKPEGGYHLYTKAELAVVIGKL